MKDIGLKEKMVMILLSFFPAMCKIVPALPEKDKNDFMKQLNHVFTLVMNLYTESGLRYNIDKQHNLTLNNIIAMLRICKNYKAINGETGIKHCRSCLNYKGKEGIKDIIFCENYFTNVEVFFNG